jgi:hypothetical protein
MVTSVKNRKAVIPMYDLRHFTWVKDKRLLVVEASDLSMTKTEPAFDIFSPKTGTDYRFVLGLEVKNSEGEIVGWHYVPALSDCPVSMVIIFND